MTSVYLTTPGDQVWVPPPGWTSVSVEMIGGGAGGVTGIASQGAGGGQYSKINTFATTPGVGINVHIANGVGPVTDGDHTWFNGTSYSTATGYAAGGLRSGAGGGNSPALPGRGDVLNNGGFGAVGGTNTGVFSGNAGGGAGGPLGPGGNGANGWEDPVHNNNGAGGGGGGNGGGANGTRSGTLGVGGVGGNNNGGSGGGTAGGGAGSNGGGGGGGSSGTQGGDGGAGTDLGGGFGSGGGGGGASMVFQGAQGRAGDGGLYGGGGGATSFYNAQRAGRGAQGIMKITVLNSLPASETSQGHIY